MLAKCLSNPLINCRVQKWSFE